LKLTSLKDDIFWKDVIFLLHIINPALYSLKPEFIPAQIKMQFI